MLEYKLERLFYVCMYLVVFRLYKGVFLSSDDVLFRCLFKMLCCVFCVVFFYCLVVNRKLKNVDLFCCLF